MTAVVQYRGRGTVCAIVQRFVHKFLLLCSGFCLVFRKKWFLRQVCITVCDQGESSRTGSKRKLVAIVDGLAAGSPYSQSVYPPTSWPYFWKFVISDLPTRTPKMLLGPRACEGLLLSCTWALHARFHSPTGGGGRRVAEPGAEGRTRRFPRGRGLRADRPKRPFIFYMRLRVGSGDAVARGGRIVRSKRRRRVDG